MLYVWGWEEAEGRFSHVSEIDCQVSNRVLHPLEVGLQADVSSPGWVLGTELWSLQEHYTLLITETSLWPGGITMPWDGQDICSEPGLQSMSELFIGTQFLNAVGLL